MSFWGYAILFHVGKNARCWEEPSHEQTCMPPVADHTLAWSTDHSSYVLYAQGAARLRHFRPDDEEQWLSWLADQTSFAFYGRSGRINVHKEARQRGGRYWYAHHSAGRRSRKRYLGQTTNLTLARLEQVAQELAQRTVPSAARAVATWSSSRRCRWRPSSRARAYPLR